MAYKRNYKKEYATHGALPEQKKKRASRNRVRSKLAKAGMVRKGDGKEVDHKKSLKSGGGNKKSNLKCVSVKKNRSKGGKSGSKSGKAAGGRKGK